MGFFSSLTWPEPVVAINAGMNSAVNLKIREVIKENGNVQLSEPYLMVGKGHIRICALGKDNPPMTLRINSFKESKQYGVKTYKWTVYNNTGDIGELTLWFENNSVAIWSLKYFDDALSFLQITSDKRSW